jgi:sulfite exporter TauE/SafE
MQIELLGIFLASLAGSWHCAGMCGPFSMLINKSSNIKTSTILYHLGRLTTYITLAVFFNTLIKPILINKFIFYALLGAWVLALVFELQIPWIKMPKFILRINQKLQGQLLGSYVLGVSTTLLPCVWLYGFLILAASKATPIHSVFVILSFWAGTLPALVASQYFFKKTHMLLGRRSRALGALVVFIVGILVFELHGSALQDTKKPASCSMHHEE